jgi:predicted ATP-dependent endonuclease of OLD family
MKIEKVQIKNFRILKDTTIDLNGDFSLIIGKNNTGKTSFLEILKKFLGTVKTEFLFDDFSIDEQQRICEMGNRKYSIDEYEEALLSMKLYLSYTDDDNIGQASEFLLDLDTEKKYFVLLIEYVLTFEKYQKLFDSYTEYKAKVQGREYRDFLASNMSHYFSIRAKALEFDNESNSKEIPLETIKQVISIETIDAKRDVDNEQGRGKSLSILANQYYRNIGSDVEFPELQQQLLEADKNLTNEYSNIFSDVVNEIRDMSYLPAESEIKIISSLIDKPIFKDNTSVKYKLNDTLLPEDYNGLGYLNLFAIMFSIRIKLNLLTKKNSQDGAKAPINLLFIEEPEAHTHPQMQYVFIRNIKKVIKKQQESVSDFNLQTIISTHSAHIVSQCDFDDIRYFYRPIDAENIVRSRNLKDLYSAMVKEASDKEQEKAFRFVKQYVTLQRAELFFADKAILIEGDTERILISAMMKKLDASKAEGEAYIPLLSQNISIIEVGAYAKVFSDFLAFIGIKTVIFTDLDCAKLGPSASEKPRQVPKACCFKDATLTTNATINFFLKTKTIGEVVAKNSDDRTFKYNQGQWEQNTLGSLRICFQSEENGYQASSFEDAFLSCNMDFVVSNKDAFQGLKCADKLVQDASDFYSLAEECIKSKTAFALDLLMNDDCSGKYWKTPKYIEEGLEWLAK